MTVLRSAILATLATTACTSSTWVVWQGRSPDRLRKVEIREASGRQRLLVDGEPGPSFEGIPRTSVVWGGGVLAYAAVEGGRWVVVHDGQQSGRWGGIGDLALSADGHRAVYLALLDGEWHAVRDERAGDAFHAIRAGTLRVSADAAHVAFVAEHGERVQVIADARPGPEVDGIAGLELMADGRPAYLARREGRFFSVVGATVGPSYDEVQHLTLSPGGTRWTHRARSGEEWRIVIDGHEEPGHQGVGVPRFDPHGRHLAYLARDADTDRVVLDGVPGPAFARISSGSLGFDPDGHRLGYIAGTATVAYAIVDGVRGPTFGKVEGLVLGTEGRHAYVARTAQGMVPIIDGVAGPAFDVVSDLRLGPGTHFAYVARSGQHDEVIHGGTRHPLGAVLADTLVLSRNGEHYGVVAGQSKGSSIAIVIDGRVEEKLDLAELSMALQEQPSDAARTALIRRWVAAQLTRVTGSQPGP